MQRETSLTWSLTLGRVRRELDVLPARGIGSWWAYSRHSGSHFRQINSLDIPRYQNLAGQAFLACEPGTVVALHHGLWHCGSRNSTDAVRYIVKIRLDPRNFEQVRLWDTSDLTDPDVTERGPAILDMAEPWYESSAVFLRSSNGRTSRRLSGDADFGEVEPWLGRLKINHFHA